MTERLLTVLLVALSGCGSGGTESEPRWKSFYSDAECRELMSLDAIEARCGNGDFDAAMRLLENDITECVPFSEPAQMEGVWVASFEHSQFYSDQSSYEEAMAHWNEHEPSKETLEKLVNTWFSTTSQVTDELPTLADSDVVDGAYTYEAFAVEFIGRKSLCPGFFGHLGASRSSVIASEILSVERLPAEDVGKH